MKQFTRDFLIGATSLVALAGLVLILFWFGELDAIVHPRYLVTIHTNDAMGVRPGSPVELNGVPIGTVDQVSVTIGETSPVEIMVLIDETIHVPQNAVPFIETSLIGASSTLILDAPARTAAAEPPTFLRQDGLASITAELQIRTIAEIRQELEERMQPVLAALDSFQLLAATYTELGRNLNDLVIPPDNVPSMAGQPSLRQTVTQINSVLEEVREAVAVSRLWLSDEQLHADASEAVKNAGILIDRATVTMDRYTELADGIETEMDQAARSLVTLSDEMALAMEEISRLSKLAREGEGTIGMALNNPDLYKSLDDAAGQLAKAAIEIQLLMQKLKDEGVKLGL